MDFWGEEYSKQSQQQTHKGLRGSMTEELEKDKETVWLEESQEKRGADEVRQLIGMHHTGPCKPS